MINYITVLLIIVSILILILYFFKNNRIEKFEQVTPHSKHTRLRNLFYGKTPPKTPPSHFTF